MKPASAWVRPIMPRTKFRKIAAMMISITMAVVFIVPSIATRSMLMDRVR